MTKCKESTDLFKIDDDADPKKEVPVLSELYTKYREILGDKQIESEKIRWRILNEEIYLEETFFNHVQIKFLKIETDSALIEIGIGYFRVKASTLRVPLQRDFDEISCLGKGAFAKIGYVRFVSEAFVCKSIFIKEGDDKIYEEYIIAKIASILEIGAKLEKIYGYDIIIFADRAQFSMELCETNFTNLLFSNIRSKMSSDLKDSLHILHSLNIAHGDIKPENIAYSKTWKKFVFIDFGISKVLKSKLGNKSLTTFHGTFFYSSDEMKKLFWLRQSSYVDVYYNDAYALKLTLQHALKMPKPETINLEKSNKVSVQISLFFRIKFNLFMGNHSQALSMMGGLSLLKKSVWKLLLQQLFSKRTSLELPLEGLLSKIKKELEAMNFQTCPADDMLSGYLQQLYRGDFAHRFFSLEDYIKADCDIRLIWNVQQRMDEIVLFLSDRDHWKSVSTRKQFQIRQKLIQKIFQFISSKAERSFLQKFRAVLLKIYGYYSEKKSSFFLQILRTLFLKIDDTLSCLKVEQTLLNLYSGREFYLKRIQFFLCLVFRHRLQTAIIFHRNIPDQQDENEQNLLYRKLQIQIHKCFCPLNMNATLSFITENYQQRIRQFLALIEESESEFRLRNRIKDMRLMIEAFIYGKVNLECIENAHIKTVIAKNWVFYHIHDDQVLQFFREDLYLPNIISYDFTLKQMQGSEASSICQNYLNIYREKLVFLKFIFWDHVTQKCKQKQVVNFCYSTFFTYFEQQKCQSFKQVLYFIISMEIMLKAKISQKLKANPNESKCNKYFCDQFVKMLRTLQQKVEELQLFVKLSTRLQLLDANILLLQGKVEESFSILLSHLHKIDVEEEMKSMELLNAMFLLQSFYLISPTYNSQLDHYLMQICEISCKNQDFILMTRVTSLPLLAVIIYVQRKQEMEGYSFLQHYTRYLCRNLGHHYLNIISTQQYLVKNIRKEVRLSLLEAIIRSTTLSSSCYYSAYFHYHIYIECRGIAKVQQRKRLLKLIAVRIDEFQHKNFQVHLAVLVFHEHRSLFAYRSARKAKICERMLLFKSGKLLEWVKGGLKLVEKIGKINFRIGEVIKCKCLKLQELL